MKSKSLRSIFFPTRIQSKKCGFTLVEVMIASSIALLVIAMTTGFFVESGKVLFVAEAKNRSNSDIRKITAEMSSLARASDYFLLFPSAAASDRTSYGDRLTAGESGDFVVFVFEGPAPDPSRLERRPIERLIGYYRLQSARPGDTAPVNKFDVAIPEKSAFEPITELIPSKLAGYPEVIEFSEGLADGRLFYNLWDRSIMVSAVIHHGNAVRSVTDTYNFTISPRGQQ